MEVISISNWINLSDFEVVFATVITTLRLNVKIVQSPMELDAQGVHNFLRLIKPSMSEEVWSSGVFTDIPQQTQLLLKCFFCLVFPGAACVTVLVG